MNHPRIDLVVGTRPEAIKLAPVAFALAAKGCGPRLLLTGQHPLNLADHGLERYERVALGCPGQRNPMAHSDLVARRMRDLLADPPALLVVQGDTSSALGGAMAGFAAGVPIAHVEAGLRSFDPAMPWPEEQNRVAIDQLSSLLFAPTATSAANLAADLVQGAVSVTGNTGIDALFAVLGRLGPVDESPRGGPLRLLVTCHRRENWGRPMRSVAGALNHLARREAVTIKIVLHTNPMVAAAMTRAIKPCAAVELVAPLSHAGMIDAMRSTDLLLSDSGGVQEEAPTLGVPLLILRERTERPEALAAGNALLVGTSSEQIVTVVRRLHRDRASLAAMARPSQPFGDGHAAPRIAGHIRRWLLHRDQRSSAA